MKTYKNINNNFFPMLFVFFIFIILILYIIDEIMYLEFKNIRYCLFVLIPIAYIITMYYNNFYSKIVLSRNNICLYKILFKYDIQLYTLLEIKEPYIMTIDKIIYLYPNDKAFWHDLEILFYEYKNYNMQFYDDTKIIYSRLLSIMIKQNEEYIANNERKHGSARGLIINLCFLWIKYLFKFPIKYSLYKEAKRIKKILKKYVYRYFKNPNFA